MKIRRRSVVSPRAKTYGPAHAAPSRADAPRPPLTKVPQIALVFWVLKLLTTGMGEAMSDSLGQQSVPLAALVGSVGIVTALRLQLRQTEYTWVTVRRREVQRALVPTLPPEHEGSREHGGSAPARPAAELE